MTCDVYCDAGLQTAILGLQFTVFRLHLLGPTLEIDLR